jgi:hypothetical protein
MMNFDVKRMIKKELNIGDKDANLRLWGGLAALFVSVFAGSIPLLLIGIALVVTSRLRWCPVYSGMEKNTCDSATEAE